MFRKLFATFAVILGSFTIAIAANLPLITTPIPASDIQAALNSLIRSINSGVGGLINAQTAAVSTTATTVETTLQQFSVPANTLSTAGQSLRATCWGTTGADSNNKTVKLYFGSSVISTGAYGGNAQSWWLDFMVMRRTATTQGLIMRGTAGTGSLTPVAVLSADGAETLTAAVLIKCTGTNGTASASDITAQGLIVESIK